MKRLNAIDIEKLENTSVASAMASIETNDLLNGCVLASTANGCLAATLCEVSVPCGDSCAGSCDPQSCYDGTACTQASLSAGTSSPVAALIRQALAL